MPNMMKKLLAPVLLFILCTVSASAESCYVLPAGWYYNSDGQIVGPEEWYSNTVGEIVGYPERTYDSIWDSECIRRLKSYDRGYGDVEYMETHLRVYSNTRTPAAGKVGTMLLSGSAALVTGAVCVRKKQARRPNHRIPVEL